MPFGTDPAEYFKNYSEETLAPPAGTPTSASVEPEAKTPWYSNPGFWAKVGSIGSALVGERTPLGQAGQVAAQYHNAMQLDQATRKVLANAAAGVDPMSGMDAASTMGLSADQITNLTKTGMVRQSELTKEGREAALAENTLATGAVSREYMGALKDKIEDELKQNAMFEQHIKDVSEGTVQSKYITPENAEFFKAVGPKRSNEIISEIVKQEEIAKRQGRKTEQVHLGDRIKLIYSDTGMPLAEWKVGAKPADEGSNKPNASLITKAENHAFQEMLPQMKEAYFKTFGKNEANARKFEDLKKLMGSPDPMVATNARNTLLSVSPDITNAYRLRVNHISDSLHKGQGVPPITGSDKGPVDRALPTGIPEPKPEDLDSLVKELMKKNNGKAPTIEQLRSAYIEKHKKGGK